jgi:uncharacterized damage-inducible protein DinB
MTTTDLREWLERSRRKTLELLDTVAKTPEPAAALGWRPGHGRAHLAWQLMHIAATDDRHLNVRMNGGDPREPDLVRRFAGGSVPDDDIPSLNQIRQYLAERREAMLAHLAGLSDADLANKPNPEAPWPYREWFQVLAWHEAHHHGQAHLTFNLYRATHDSATNVGH